MKFTVFVLAMLATIQLVQSAAINQDGDGESSQITITKLGGASQQVDFSESDTTVGQLKARISQLDGAPAGDLILVFGGKQMTDDSKLLTDYGIQQDSKVIFLQRPAKSPQQQQQQQQQQQKPREESRPSTDSGSNAVKGAIENLFVRASSGAMFEVPADAELTVSQLKLVIAMLVNIPAETLHLDFNSAPLEDQKTLAECGLHNESVLNLSIDRATARAQTAVLERVVKRIIAMLVKRINNDGQPKTKLTFQHDPQFTELDTVMQMVGERILSDFKRAENQSPLILDVYRSKDLRVEFGYEFRGERKSTLANLNDGAEWVVAQAKAAVAVETNEVDQSENEIFGASSTTPQPL